jgi:hypothetical protein
MDDEQLLEKQAEFLGVDPVLYKRAEPSQRNAFKASFAMRMRREARDQGLDEDKHAAEALKKFPSKDEIISEKNGQVLVRHTPERVEAVARKRRVVTSRKAPEEGDDDDEDIPIRPKTSVFSSGSYVEQDGVKVYSEGGELPPAEEDPFKRDGVSIGPIEELERPPLVPDLAGDRPPRTLLDLYSRWPIERDTEYSIRIERTKPKRYSGMDVAGFVGEIRGRAVNEGQLQRWLGGNEYLLTVYGPDPRGKRDSNDNVIIKPLTEPIKLVVPVLPPNPRAIPANQELKASMAPGDPFNPFGQQAPMTTQHDASIHKTNMEYMLKMSQMNKEDEKNREKAEMGLQQNIFSVLSSTQNAQMAAMQESMREQNRLHEKMLEAEREGRKEAERKTEQLLRTIEEKTGQKGLDLDGVTKLVTTMNPNREAETQRLIEQHRMQLDSLRANHDETIKTLRAQQSDEMSRAKDRIQEVESFYKRLLEEERIKAADRERDLRNEMDKIRRDEKDAAAARIADMKERYEAELKQVEKSHERELRSLKESWDTKLTVSERLMETEKNTLKERLEETKEEIERVREEAKESSDPALVLARAREQAEALGYEKKDDAPKTALERFAATAGAGLSQALASINDWGPKVMAARAAGGPPQMMQGGPPPRGLPAAPGQRRMQGSPQQMQPQPQQAPPRRRVPRGAVWAAEGVAPPPIQLSEEPLGFQKEEPQQTPPPQQAVVVEAEQPQESVVPENPNPWNFPEKFIRHFQPEAMAGFLQQADQSINGQIDPTVFAEQFVARFPGEARTLVQHIQPEEVVAHVRTMDGAETSALVRRDGEKWLQALWRDLEKRTAG